jgi:hypothetical protein
MSLRKSPQLTPELLAAARQNAQHSTGPRSPAAKQNSKLNALKHGAYVADENHHEVENRNSKNENRESPVEFRVSILQFRFSGFEFRSLKGSSGRKRA